MSDIFISYFRKDRPKAEMFARAFEAVGWSVWWDRTIPAGGTFDKIIEEALNGAKVVIVLWSNASVQSRWVLNEAEEAASRNLLVPVLIEPDVPIPLAFKRIQAADFVEWDGELSASSFQDLVTDISWRVGQAPLLARPTTPPVPVAPGPPADPSNVVRVETPRDDVPLRPLSPSSLLHSRARLTGVLAAVFCVNYAETMVETMLRQRYGLGSELGARIASAFRGLEGNLTFESHDVTNWLAVYGYSIAYFFLLPLMAFGLIFALWRRPDIRGYRILCLSVAVDYLLSVGFFVFFPVPERWAFPESGAILLSDRWSSNLIEALRPISGLDNCFPSSHVSLTVVVILVGYVCRVRFRHTLLALGTTIALSTFVLGIHWIPDILAGLAVGFLSVASARYLSPLRGASAASRLPTVVRAPASSTVAHGGVLARS